MSEKTPNKVIKIFSIVVFAYGFYRFCNSFSSIGIFALDPFYLQSLRTRNIEGVSFYLLLSYMNFNLFLIVVSSICYTFWSFHSFYTKLWALRLIKNLSVLLFVYSIITLFVFSDFTKMEFGKILEQKNIFSMIKVFMLYYYDVIFFLFAIIASSRLLAGKGDV